MGVFWALCGRAFWSVFWARRVRVSTYPTCTVAIAEPKASKQSGFVVKHIIKTKTNQIKHKTTTTTEYSSLCLSLVINEGYYNST